jgi:uncharacterized protein YndB with AHSA1/START domain
MTVTDVRKDPAARTMNITAEYDAPASSVWQLWADPRLLERWWGPPTYPATFVDHDLSPGGDARYFMTGPEGDRHFGWWRITSVDAPHRLAFEDGFGDAEGQPDPNMPVMTIEVRITDAGASRTRMEIETTFPSTDAMDQLITMGMEEGMQAAMGQIDELLLSVG